MRLALFACVFVVASGCAAVSPLGRARTLEKGRTEVMAAPQVGSVKIGRAAFPSLQLETAFRRGVTDDLELGGRLWTFPVGIYGAFGVAAEGKLQLRRSGSRDEGVDVALVPTAGYQLVNLGGFLTHMPLLSGQVLAGMNLGGGRQLVAGARTMGQLWAIPRNGTHGLLFFGGSLGLVLPVSERLSLVPELCFLVSPSQVRHGDSLIMPRGSGTLQFAVGFLFDHPGGAR